MKVVFWLLDINTETTNDVAELWLWGITENGERVLIIDGNFCAYFHVVVQDGFDPLRVAAEIKKAHNASIVKLEIAARRFFGKPVQTVKIYCRKPDATAKLAKTLRTLEGVQECLEDDIRLSMQYLISNNVAPCGWHEIEATEKANTIGVRADKVYSATSFPKLLDRTDVPPLRTLSFSMIGYSREGSPKPDRNPVIVISTAASSGEEKQFLATMDKDDTKLLQEFMAYIKKFDPDIIVSYGANTLDWLYIKERCRKLGLELRVDRAGTEPHSSVYGHVSLTGIANLDLADFIDEFPDVKVKNLQNLAAHLGIMATTQHAVVEDVDFAAYWDDAQKRELLKNFSLDNSRRVKGAATVLLGFAMQLSSLISLPLDHVMTAAVGFRVEWFLIKHAQKIGELVPKRAEQAYVPYAGGIVLKPQAGLHENIAVLDFKSMYPNIMITYNLSPDTYVAPSEPAPIGGVFEAPEVKHRFRREPSGFYKEVLSYLIGVRGEIRVKMRALSASSVAYQVLDARQKAVKVITNAAYGYAGWVGARWYRKPVAEAASAWGRYMILAAVRIAEETGLKVIYGDTDSLFVAFDEEKTGELEKRIEQALGLDIERGKVYTRVFFTEAKKRYAGLLPDGSFDIVGLEVIRGDWAEVAKKVQEGVLEIILKEKSVEKAVDFVRSVIAEVRQRKVAFRDLIIWKTLTKPVEEYKVNAAHVEAAKMLARKGWALTVGDKVGYVVLAGEGRLYDRVKPYVFAVYSEVDVDYYVLRQVVPAAVRVLEFFGVTEKQLLETAKKEKGSLMDFVGS
ncbi:MAG: DNA polymerase II [Candidatus Bathyarchaeota archaeon]|nr:DNA polymerase II [Candidatus Bathyarchaeota archaeon]